MDADADDIRDWYLERFAALRAGAFTDPHSYFRAGRVADAGETMGQGSGTRSCSNLVENIEPTRERATAILRKGSDHVISEVRIRKI